MESRSFRWHVVSLNHSCANTPREQTQTGQEAAASGRPSEKRRSILENRGDRLPLDRHHGSHIDSVVAGFVSQRRKLC